MFFHSTFNVRCSMFDVHLLKSKSVLSYLPERMVTNGYAEQNYDQNQNGSLFCVCAVFFIVFAALSIRGMNELGDLTSTLYDHPLKVSTAALKAKAGVIRMHRSMKDVAMSKTEMEIRPAIQTVQSEEKLVYQDLDIVKSRILGEEGKTPRQPTKR